MKTIDITLQQLHKMVWTEPLSTLAKKYALSDNGFRKLCKKNNIPLPKNGYWQKLKYNKVVKIEKLTNTSIEKNSIKLVLRSEGSTISYDQPLLTIRTKEIQNDNKAPLNVPQTILKPHHLSIETKRHWADFKINKYNYDKSISYISIRVTNENRKRALILMDTFIKLLEYRGHKVIIQRGDTVAVLNDVEVKLDLREASRRIPKPGSYPTFELEDTGEFILKTGKYSIDKEWRDGKNKIETILAKIVAWMEIETEKWAEWREKNRIAQLQREEENKKQEELAILKQIEINKFNRLLDDAQKYTKAKEIRTYIQAVEEKAKTENTMNEELQNWLHWANSKADGYDPLISKVTFFVD